MASSLLYSADIHIVNLFEDAHLEADDMLQPATYNIFGEFSILRDNHSASPLLHIHFPSSAAAWAGAVVASVFALVVPSLMSTIYSQPASTSTGQDARTNVLYAITRLKEKSPQAIPRDELVSYVLPAQAVSGDPQRVQLFLTFLNNNEKVTYHRDTDSYSFRPLHNIFTADDLLKYLQLQETATGISVRDLKDGWADVETTIDKLEREHRLLVTRNKKDNHPRMVWIDDPTLWLTIDGEYKDIWENIPVPDKPDDIIKALTTAGFKPAGTVSKPVTKKVDKLKKKVRRGHKTTNTHMQGLFKDYSALKPKAAT